MKKILLVTLAAGCSKSHEGLEGNAPHEHDMQASESSHHAEEELSSQDAAISESGAKAGCPYMASKSKGTDKSDSTENIGITSKTKSACCPES